MTTRTVKLLVGCLALGFAPGAFAATTLIYDDFSSAGNLQGKAPTTSALGAITWQASTSTPALQSNGSVLLADTTAARRATLDLGSGYLAANAGVYTLSLDVRYPTVSDSSAWVALGFTNGYTDGNSNFNQANDTGGAPWLFLRPNGALQVYGGRALTNTLLLAPAGTFPGAVTYTLELVLDTEPTNWTLDAFVNGIQLDLNGASSGNTYTFSSNPAIRYVGFSTSGSAGGPEASLDHFRLSVVPEPGAVSLLAVASLLGVAAVRRRLGGRWLVLAAACTPLWCSASEQALLRDDFSAGGLLGQQPLPVGNIGQDAIWKCNPAAFSSDGRSVRADTSLPRRASVDVGPLLEEPGVYALGMQVRFPQDAENDRAWVALGFSEGYTSGDTNFTQSDTTGGSPWLLMRANGALEVYHGAGLKGTLLLLPEGRFPAGVTYALELVLNTKADDWTLDVLVDGEPLDLNRKEEGFTAVLAHRPTIRHIGFSTAGLAGGPIVELANLTLIKRSSEMP